jgi:hypothetical protein
MGKGASEMRAEGVRGADSGVEDPRGGAGVGGSRGDAGGGEMGRREVLLWRGVGLSGVSGTAGDDLARRHPGETGLFHLRRMWAGIFPPWTRRKGLRGAGVSEGWSRWCGQPKR